MLATGCNLRWTVGRVAWWCMLEAVLLVSLLNWQVVACLGTVTTVSMMFVSGSQR